MTITTTDHGVGLYVACLASYNNGILHGAWIEGSDLEDLDCLKEAIEAVLEASPEPGAEEYAIHDHEGLPDFLRGEWPNLSDVVDYCQQLTKCCDDTEQLAYRKACEAESQVMTKDDALESYMGCYDSEADFAEQYYLERCSFPEEIQPLINHVDWGQVWECEFDCAGWWSHRDDDGNVLIFSA